MGGWLIYEFDLYTSKYGNSLMKAVEGCSIPKNKLKGCYLNSGPCLHHPYYKENSSQQNNVEGVEIDESEDASRELTVTGN